MPKYNNLDPSKQLEIYTDGGCQGNGKSENIGGYGVVVIQNNTIIQTIHESYTNTTNNKMEIKGVIEALRWCVENDYRGITIFSDSNYTISGATIWKTNWLKNNMTKSDKKPVLNKELWLELYKLDSKVNAKFQWVKAHAGNKFNEIADCLTRGEEPNF